MNNQPMILTTKEHNQCNARWAQFKDNHPERVALAYRIFDLCERSVETFSDPVPDWIDAGDLFERVYGTYSPIDTLLEAMHFPPDSPACNRSHYAERVHDLILEHDRHGSNGLYMARSVVLGWIALSHDHLLGDLNEEAA